MSKIINTTAASHAAAHRAALLLDRCRYQLLFAPTRQARWHQQQQTQFLAWLDAGGFAQNVATKEKTKENSGFAPLFSAPQRDLHEES